MSGIKRDGDVRGFVRFAFTDDYGEHCTLQESSSVEEPKIWLGTSGKVSVFTPYANPPWVHYEGDALKAKMGCRDGGAVLTNSRMHLTREQVRELIPYLEAFVATGCLPAEPLAEVTP